MSRAAGILLGAIAVAAPLHVVPAFPAIALFAVWCLRFLKSPRRPHPAALVLVVNYLYWSISLAATAAGGSTVASYAFMRWQSRLPVGFLVYLALSTPHLGVTDRLARRLLLLFLAASSAVVLLGVAQLLLGAPYQAVVSIGPYAEFEAGPVVSRFGQQWFFGFHRSHVAAGAFYLIPALVGLSLFLFGPPGRTCRLSALVAFAFASWGLVFTKARGAWIGFALAVGVALILSLQPAAPTRRGRRSGRVASLLAVGAVLLIVLLTVPDVLARVGWTATWTVRDLGPAASAPPPSGENLAVATMRDRLLYWRAALALFGERPLFGIGLGQYPYRFARDYSAGLQLPWPHPEAYHAHSSYLHVLAELGIVGLGLFLLFWALTLRALISALRTHHRGTLPWAFAFGVILAVVAELVVALVDYNLASPTAMLPLGLLVGLALSLAGCPVPVGRPSSAG